MPLLDRVNDSGARAVMQQATRQSLPASAAAWRVVQALPATVRKPDPRTPEPQEACQWQSSRSRASISC